MLLLVFSACISGSPGQQNIQQPADTAAVVQPQQPESHWTDSLPVIAADDYPVTDMMFKESRLDNGDRVWFFNDSLQQTLAFELYTDYHRLIIWDFLQQDVPEELLLQMGLYKGDREITDVAEMRTMVSDFTRAGIHIDPVYFTSNKGFRIGDNKEHAEKVLGPPDTIRSGKDTEILEWNFTGDMMANEYNDIKRKPLVKNSFGHQVTMFFRKDSLVAIRIYNDIP